MQLLVQKFEATTKYPEVWMKKFKIVSPVTICTTRPLRTVAKFPGVSHEKY